MTGALGSVFDNLASPIFGAILLQGIILQPGLNQVQHTLGKNLTGWIVVDKNAPVDISRSPDPNSLPGSYLQLLSGGTVTISLLVF